MALVIAYSRSQTLHAAEMKDDQRSALSLCGRAHVFRHPDFNSPNTAVALSLSFNDGCRICLRKLETD